jgi:hypothetical protein
MVLARWQRTIVDDAGNILPGAQVTVRREVSGAPLAVLYSDRDGTTPLGNPFTADGDGFAAFHVVGGAYRITATAGAFASIWRYVGIGTASENDVADLLDPATSLNRLSGSFYAPDANIWRIADRIFVGEAVNANGTNNSQDQGSIIPDFTVGASWLVTHATLLSTAIDGQYAIVGITRASDQVGLDGSIGVAGAVISDREDVSNWAMYADVQHETGSRYSYGIEIAIKNKSTNNAINDPYDFGPLDAAFGIWLAGGGDNTYGGNSVNPSCAAIIIGANSHTWNKGIVFGAAGLTGADGSTGTASAIAMGRGHKLEWYYDDGDVGFDIYSDVGEATDAHHLFVDTNGFRFRNDVNTGLFRIAKSAGTINSNVAVAAANTGVASILGEGSATDVSLSIRPKAAGSVVINHTASLGVGAGNAVGKLQVHGAASDASVVISRFSNSATGPAMHLTKSRDATVGVNTIVQNGDNLGTIQFGGADGTGVILAAAITGLCGGVPGTNDMPGALSFSTTQDGAATVTEALRIDAAQKVIFQSDRAPRFNNQTSAAAAATGTLTNAPAAGNPGFWLKINIGGTNYAIPCWAG